MRRLKGAKKNMKSNTGLVKFAESKIGTPYVYGAKGEVLTAEKYAWLKKTYGSMVKDSDKAKIGRVCTDCSGLISWFTGKIRNSTGFHDSAKKVHPISTISNAPIGSAVWKKGHIGIYIGNGYIIEAMGSAYGVVKTRVESRNFTHWFEIADIKYMNIIDNKTYYPKYTGSSVSIVDGLNTIGVDSSFSNRKKIAEANHISGYKGTAKQNTDMLNLLKSGKLIKA